MITHLSGGTDIFLQPGEFYFGEAGTVIRTTLGSCVAITLWHPRRRVGGMCHYMLPAGKDGDGAPGRYAEGAMQLFLSEIHASRTQLGDYEAKLFGGANMFPQHGIRRPDEGVPARNIAKAKELVLRYGLKVKAESLGGVGYRQVIFDIGSGDVWARQVRHAEQTGTGR